MIIDKITPFGAEALVVLVLSNISNLIYWKDEGWWEAEGTLSRSRLLRLCYCLFRIWTTHHSRLGKPPRRWQRWGERESGRVSSDVCRLVSVSSPEGEQLIFLSLSTLTWRAFTNLNKLAADGNQCFSWLEYSFVTIRTSDEADLIKVVKFDLFTLLRNIPSSQEFEKITLISWCSVLWESKFDWKIRREHLLL